jgi:signal peptidase I
MAPGILAGDWVVLRIESSRVVGVRQQQPAKRGSVIVIAMFDDWSVIDQDHEKFVLKRIVGVAGDTVQMRNGQFLVNAPAIAGDRPANIRPVDQVSPQFAWQKTVGLRGSRFGDPPREPSRDNWGPLVVPADHLFVLGDNRMHSRDSRYFGFVPRANLVAAPIFIYFSVSPGRGVLGRVRWSRLGLRVR